MPAPSDVRFETVLGFDEDVYVELWECAEPRDLAFAIRRSDDGEVMITGFDIDVPIAAFQKFLSEGLAYLAEDPEVLLDKLLQDRPDTGSAG
jgi:hypothetical protein